MNGDMNLIEMKMSIPLIDKKSLDWVYDEETKFGEFTLYKDIPIAKENKANISKHVENFRNI